MPRIPLNENELAICVILLLLLLALPPMLSVGIVIGLGLGIPFGAEMQYRDLKQQVRGKLAGFFLRFRD
jgi:hypothetical protein